MMLVLCRMEEYKDTTDASLVAEDKLGVGGKSHRPKEKLNRKRRSYVAGCVKFSWLA